MQSHPADIALIGYVVLVVIIGIGWHTCLAIVPICLMICESHTL